MKKKLLLMTNVDSFFISHRLEIGLEALKKGYEVHVSCLLTKNNRNFLKKKGFFVHNVNFHRSSLNIFSFFKNLLEIFFLFNSVKPNIVHLVSIKPVILGGIVCKILKVPSVVFSITGLGSLYLSKSFLFRIYKLVINHIYQFIFTHKNIKIIFQNKSDLYFFKKKIKLDIKKTILIKGSGVPLKKYSSKKIPVGRPIILMASRFLKDKGIFEFLNSAKILKEKKINAEFVLVGSEDQANPSRVSLTTINEWEKKKIISNWGFQKNMNYILSKATIVVLPSYREGFPKVLMEAAACGRPVITTNVAGCRDAVKHNITGMLVPVRNSRALANAIIYLLKNKVKLTQMGKKALLYAKKNFDIKNIVKKNLEIYSELCPIKK
jgi:glycosyltransferase involved in cell wall biosynthesis